MKTIIKVFFIWVSFKALSLKKKGGNCENPNCNQPFNIECKCGVFHRHFKCLSKDKHLRYSVIESCQNCRFINRKEGRIKKEADSPPKKKPLKKKVKIEQNSFRIERTEESSMRSNEENENVITVKLESPQKENLENGKIFIKKTKDSFIPNYVLFFFIEKLNSC